MHYLVNVFHLRCIVEKKVIKYSSLIYILLHLKVQECVSMSKWCLDFRMPVKLGTFPNIYVRLDNLLGHCNVLAVSTPLNGSDISYT